MALFALVFITWFSALSLRELYLDEKASELESKARLLEGDIRALLENSDEAGIDALCKELGPKGSIRITVILTNGRVVGDTESEPSAMENHKDRPEIAAALSGETGSSIRYSRTVRKTMMYLAIPLQRGDATIGVVRASVPITAIERAIVSMQLRIVYAAILVALFAALISLILSRRISRPLEAMKGAAERFARGRLDEQIPPEGSAETAGLAQALNEMASQLSDMLNTIRSQRDQMDAVLTSMSEGVIAVDRQERLFIINYSAARLFKVEAGEAMGKPLGEITRAPDLLNLISSVIRGIPPAETEVIIRGGDERVIKAMAEPLQDLQGNVIGALLLLRDVTRESRLEQVRKEFVANVSHELRTPITAIKGFAETLLDTAPHDAQESERFLRTIVRHADRLNSIIEDLLTLSRIEQEAEHRSIIMEPGSIRMVLEAAVEEVAALAGDFGVALKIRCEEDIEAPVNASLLQQAVANLIDNAIKYGKEGKEVEVSAEQREDEVVIRVKDYGPGIPKDHLARVFERFYRIDRSASRKFGGTGLGLAIVKHVAIAHGGRAEVESAPGKGSTFSIHLPAKPGA